MFVTAFSSAGFLWPLYYADAGWVASALALASSLELVIVYHTAACSRRSLACANNRAVWRLGEAVASQGLFDVRGNLGIVGGGP